MHPRFVYGVVVSCGVSSMVVGGFIMTLTLHNMGVKV